MVSASKRQTNANLQKQGVCIPSEVVDPVLPVLVSVVRSVERPSAGDHHGQSIDPGQQLVNDRRQRVVTVSWAVDVVENDQQVALTAAERQPAAEPLQTTYGS